MEAPQVPDDWVMFNGCGTTGSGKREREQDGEGDGDGGRMMGEYRSADTASADLPPTASN